MHQSCCGTSANFFGLRCAYPRDKAQGARHVAERLLLTQTHTRYNIYEMFQGHRPGKCRTTLGVELFDFRGWNCGWLQLIHFNFMGVLLILRNQKKAGHGKQDNENLRCQTWSPENDVPLGLLKFHPPKTVGETKTCRSLWRDRAWCVMGCPWNFTSCWVGVFTLFRDFVLSFFHDWSCHFNLFSHQFLFQNGMNKNISFNERAQHRWRFGCYVLQDFHEGWKVGMLLRVMGRSKMGLMFF